MRIGIVCPYSLDVPGGVQNHAQGLAEALRTRGHSVQVLAPGVQPTPRDGQVVTVGRSVPIRFNGSVARVAFGPYVFARTRRWLQEGRFDIVHVHEPLTPSVSVLALWASDAAVVATFHTANPHSKALSLAARLLRRSTDKISVRVAVSDTARGTLLEHMGVEPVVIPNGIFCEDFASAESRPEDGDGPTIVFVGRTDEPRKGLPVLLAAFAQVAAVHPTVRLLIAGRGPHAASPTGSRPSRISYLGMVSDAEKARLLASATVYVAPHVGGESFGVVLVEAMAAGAAVVASDLPAFRAVLDDGRLGALFPVGDAAAAASSILGMLGDAGHRDRVRAAARIGAQGYDWAVVAPRIEAMYESVVNDASAPASLVEKAG